MRFFKNLRRVLGRSAAQPDDLILVTLGEISSALVKHFGNGYYRWREPNEIRTFECLILAKFFVDYALDTMYRDKVVQVEFTQYQAAIDARFHWLLENTFSNRFNHELLNGTIENRLSLYREAMDENHHPICWQVLASVVTGIDYYAEKDLPTLTASSLALPEFLVRAQDTLRRTERGVESDTLSKSARSG